jgi:hypothetical protein
MAKPLPTPPPPPATTPDRDALDRVLDAARWAIQRAEHESDDAPPPGRRRRRRPDPAALEAAIEAARKNALAALVVMRGWGLASTESDNFVFIDEAASVGWGLPDAEVILGSLRILPAGLREEHRVRNLNADPVWHEGDPRKPIRTVVEAQEGGVTDLHVGAGLSLDDAMAGLIGTAPEAGDGPPFDAVFWQNGRVLAIVTVGGGKATVRRFDRGPTKRRA